ncbi:hypothetical protein PSP31121_05615 [Pandoraea sputorum]|uniref:Uncharacterized protein n=1 Tax=Pandoraea sputorum TaxID=93222 RepID=A0A5E5BL25_9BURK|nr:hypothetical protein PSP31121_05615 [Pandoraea sputorum]
MPHCAAWRPTVGANSNALRQVHSGAAPISARVSENASVTRGRRRGPLTAAARIFATLASRPLGHAHARRAARVSKLAGSEPPAGQAAAPAAGSATRRGVLLRHFSRPSSRHLSHPPHASVQGRLPGGRPPAPTRSVCRRARQCPPYPFRSRILWPKCECAKRLPVVSLSLTTACLRNVPMKHTTTAPYLYHLIPPRPTDVRPPSPLRARRRLTSRTGRPPKMPIRPSPKCRNLSTSATRPLTPRRGRRSMPPAPA